jgi:hypothetical protein
VLAGSLHLEKWLVSRRKLKNQIEEEVLMADLPEDIDQICADAIAALQRFLKQREAEQAALLEALAAKPPPPSRLA